MTRSVQAQETDTTQDGWAGEMLPTQDTMTRDLKNTPAFAKNWNS